MYLKITLYGRRKLLITYFEQVIPMPEDSNTTDELKKDIITAIYQDINDNIQEMVDDLDCPRSFAETLLRSIANNFKDGTKAAKNESSYSSRHASTPEHERGAEEIVTQNEKIIRETLNTYK